jgi:hypothetical protein
MAQKAFGEIVKQSVAIAAFAGIGIILLANVTGNQHWYKSDYGTVRIVWTCQTEE